MRGRKTIPTPLKVLQGLSGGRLLSERPGTGSPVPACPRWLDKDAKAEWKKIVPELEAQGVLARVDAAGLAAYCVAVSRWQAAELEIQKSGQFTTDHNGVVRQHPATRVADQLLKQIRTFAVEFGLTPKSRGRIEAPPPPNEEVDELEAFCS